MIWHIFKKDCRLLWSFAIVVAALNSANAYLWTTLGHFLEPTELRMLASILPMVALLGMAVLIAMTIHQDAIPGTTQDWLIRPIQRRDLLFAKLLFVIVMVHGPLFVVDVIQGLANGMSFTISTNAAVADVVTKFCLFSLSAFALAVVTRNLIESFIAGFVLAIICVAITAIVTMTHTLPPQIAGSGVMWIGLVLMQALIVVFAAIVLPRQYLRRATIGSRGFIVAGVLAVMAANFVPWRLGFAAQQQLAAQPGLGNSIAIAFEPSIGKRPTTPGAIDGSLAYGGVPTIFLPLRIDGLAEDSLLFLDRAEVRLVSASGATLYQGASYLSLDGSGRVYDSRFVVRNDAGPAAAATQYQTIFISPKIYAGLKNQSVRLEIDYSLTLLQSKDVSVMRALDGEMRTRAGEWCKSRVDADEDELQVACLIPSKRPSCASIALVHDLSGTSNPKVEGCVPNYAPFNINLSPSLLYRASAVVPFLDLTGAVHYPVDGSKLPDAKLVIHTYEAQDHFTRQLVIPEIRLSDWEGAGRYRVKVD